MAKAPIRVVVGFYNFTDLQALQDGLAEHNARVAANPDSGLREFIVTSAAQDAQRVYDEAIKDESGADVVLLSPDIRGYRAQLLRDLLLFPARPIPVIGWVLPQGEDGRIMEANGAKGVVTLPMDARSVARFISQAEDAVEAALRERASGKLNLGIAQIAAGRQMSWQQKMITVYVPKGGGSTRTTLATNLAVAFAHVTLGNQPTCLVDLDMAKGDCHTLLGMVTDPELAIQEKRLLVDRGLFELVVNALSAWPTQNENAVNPALIHQFLAHWSGAESQLDLLPGLLSPHQAGRREFANWSLVYPIARRLLQELRGLYPFIIVDIGQDYNLPLHKAAIEEADEVLVTVPPTRTALVDTVNAMLPLKTAFGNLKKFKLVITAYDPAFGISEGEIQKRVGLPKLATIPFDALVAHQAVNTATPFVLTDDGPLGDAIRQLAAVYYPDLGQVVGAKKRAGLFGSLKRIVVRDA